MLYKFLLSLLLFLHLRFGGTYFPEGLFLGGLIIGIFGILLLRKSKNGEHFDLNLTFYSETT